MLVDTLDLDATHPTLSDHRPGGLPLFGTVMSVEALGATALRLSAAPPDFVFEDVEILHPCLLAEGARHRLTIRLSDVDGGLAGEVVSLEPALATLHLRARLRSAATTADPGLVVPAPPTGPAVGAADIYSLFFHGPSFRVVMRAQFQDGVLAAELANHREVANIPMSARLLEFALQSAGLLELATSDRMMIPHRIARIVPGRLTDADVQGPVFAHARYGAHGGVDIAVMAASAPIMTVEAYQTVPLPFEFDTAAAQRLADKLRAGAE